MTIHIERAQRREKALRRSLNKSARTSPQKVHGLVRRYLWDADFRVVAAHQTYLRLRDHTRPKWRPFANEMLQSYLWSPCVEPVYARAYEKDGANKDFRPILVFGPENKFRQTLVRNCLRSFARLHPGQFGMCGGPNAAWEEIETAYANGYQHLVQLDVEACFRSICREQLHTCLKLPKEVTNNIVRAGNLNIIPSRKLLSFLGYDEGPILLEEIFQSEDLQAFRTGIPQGSIASPLCAAMLFKSVIEAMPNGVVVVNYADDFMIMCKDAEEATDARERLRSALKSHPAGMLTPGLDYQFGPHEPFSFLGYDVFPEQAKLRFQIGERTQKRKRPGKAHHSYSFPASIIWAARFHGFDVFGSLARAHAAAASKNASMVVFSHPLAAGP